MIFRASRIASSAFRLSRRGFRPSLFSQSLRRSLTIGFVGLAFSYSQIRSATCTSKQQVSETKNENAGKDEKCVSTEEDAAFDMMMSYMAPFLGQLTYGSALGGCTGYALKKMTKAAAFAIGSVFLLLQVLAFKGYIFVDWKKVEKDVVESLDQDGDGDFDGDDVKIMMGNIWSFLKWQLPSAGGFGTGFYLGWRYG